MVLNLFSNWQPIRLLLSKAHPIFLLLDYDGALTPIAARPSLVKLPKATRMLLSQLAENARCKLAVISGRTIQDLKSQIGLQRIYYAGNHGLEIEGPGFTFIHPDALRLQPKLLHVNQTLRGKLTHIKGLYVESKRLTFAVHYRAINPRDLSIVKKTLKETLKLFPELKAAPGKKVLEVKPDVPWSKGDAALRILQCMGDDGLPVYVGDDSADEDVFQKLSDGLTVRVGKTSTATAAKYFISNQRDVATFLKQVLIGKEQKILEFKKKMDKQRAVGE